MRLNYQTKRLSLSVWLLAILPSIALAETEKPLWELGLGGAAVSFPAYRGSDKIYNYILPFPYFVYRGDIFKADRHGTRASLWDGSFVNMTLSGSASPLIKSSDIAAREHMPNLKPTVELGPDIDFTLWKSADSALKLRLPWRMAFTVSSNSQNAGQVFSPNLNLELGNITGLKDWNLGLVLGPSSSK